MQSKKILLVVASDLIIAGESSVFTGVQEIRDGGNVFHIFDIEKTVMDIIYYRNKVGIEETSEVLKNILKERNGRLTGSMSMQKDSVAKRQPGHIWRC